MPNHTDISGAELRFTAVTFRSLYWSTVVFFLGLFALNQALAQGYRSDLIWPQFEGYQYFRSPYGVVCDSEDNLYVCDYGLHRIVKLSPSGEFLYEWGSPGSGDGQLSGPIALAIDDSNRIYVGDSDDYRVQVFDSHGTFLRKFGYQGYQPANLGFPIGIAVDKDGFIHIADASNNRIQTYTNEGWYITDWGTLGTGEKQFNHPRAIAVDSSGNLYVADSGNNRIQKFKSNGEFVAQWGSVGDGDLNFLGPAAVTLDAQGHLYIGDSNNLREYSTNGLFISRWAGYPNYYQVNAIAATSNGDLYVSGSGDKPLKKVSATGSVLKTWRKQFGYAEGEFFSPMGVALDEEGSVFVIEYQNCRIQKFDADGNFLLTWGSRGTGPSQFNSPCSVAVAANGDVFVSDAGNHRIQRFDVNGQFVLEFGGEGNTEFWPNGIALDLAGNLLVAGGVSVYRFTTEGTLLDELTTPPGSGLFFPEDVAVDSTGNVYASDSYHKCVRKFSAEGEFLFSFGGGGAEDGEFERPVGVATDLDNNVFVTDVETHRIQKFSESGEFLAKWGGYGSARGKISLPYDCAVDDFGNVYVADTLNDRIQRFTPDSEAPFVTSVARGGDSPTNSETVDFDISFTEPVTGIDSSDFLLSTSGVIGAAIVSMHAAGEMYNVTVSTGIGDGSIRLDVIDDNSIQDEAQNPLGGMASGDGDFQDGETISVDKSPPVVLLASSVDISTKRSPIPITIRFSESMIDFDQSRIVIEHGVLNNLVIGLSKWSFDLVPAGRGIVSVRTLEGFGRDRAGNESEASEELLHFYGSDKPTVSMIATNTDPATAARITVAISFSRPVRGFNENDLQTKNCTIKKLTKLSGKAYTMVLTPNAAGMVEASIPKESAHTFSGETNQPGRYRILYTGVVN